jgi:hypothetical protein
MRTSSHILNAATNLLGISLLIIAGLHIANASGKTLADEIAWGGVVCFAASCVFSYMSLRGDDPNDRFERLADKIFLLGTATLLLAVLVLAVFDL